MKYVESVVELFLQDGVECSNIHNMIGLELDCKTMEDVLAFYERNIESELGRRNETTGLYPFMSVVMSTQLSLADIYIMRKEIIF